MFQLVANSINNADMENILRNNENNIPVHVCVTTSSDLCLGVIFSSPACKFWTGKLHELQLMKTVIDLEQQRFEF